MPRHFKNPRETTMGFILDLHTVDAPIQAGETCSVKAATLLVHQGEYYRWNGQCWEIFPLEALREALIQYLPQHDVDWAKVIKPKEINDVIHTFVGIIRQAQSAPCWRPDPNISCKGMVAFTNITGNVLDGSSMPHDPRAFVTWGVPYELDLNARCPEWDKFLISIWGEEEQVGVDANGAPIMAKQGAEGTRAGALQEAFGYVMSGDKSLQRIIIFVGAKRGGKGTIARILAALVGVCNVAWCTFHDMRETLEKESLIGKPLWIAPDERLPRNFEAKMPQVLQLLLSVSGNDPQNIPRKNKTAWHGVLPTNIMVVSNSVISIDDVSQAWLSRLLMFTFIESFVGREDTELEGRLLQELPGIFNWALEGRKRLTLRGRFVQPFASLALLKTLAETSSPIQEFIDECCEVAPHTEVERDVIYAEYCRFCRRGRIRPEARNTFGRQLGDALLGQIGEGRPRRLGGKRTYKGIGLRTGDHDRIQVKKIWLRDWAKYQPITAEHIKDDVHGALRAVINLYAGEPTYLSADVIEECLRSMKDVDDEGYVLRRTKENAKGEGLWEVSYTKPAAPTVVPST
jgi:putative DNA primase/helicase